MERTLQKAKGTLLPDRKIFIYSGHDLTIVSLLRTMGFDNYANPGFGAILLIELYCSNEHGHAVKVRLYYSFEQTIQCNI